MPTHAVPDPSSPGPRPVWRRLLGPGTAVVVVALVAVRAPHLFLGTARSPKALAVVAAATAVLVGAGRLRRVPALVRHGARVAAVVAIAGFVALPALRTTSVDEPLPALSVQPPVAGPTADTAVGAGATTTAPSPTTSTSTAAPAAPRSAPVRGLTGHRAEGTAALLAASDGSQLVRLEAFKVSAGPDYDVYVVPGAGATRPAGGVRLGDLKATSGNQNYALPATFATAGAFTFLVWCEAYDIEVAAATLA